MENLSDNPDSPILWRLIDLAAPIIAGRDCIVKRRGPTAGIYGETSVNLEGVPVIAMAEDLQGDEFTATLLHELAHVKLHSHTFARSNADIDPPEYKPHLVNTTQEDQADNQTAEWLAYGETNRNFKDPYALGVIYALINKYQQ